MRMTEAFVRPGLILKPALHPIQRGAEIGACDSTAWTRALGTGVEAVPAGSQIAFGRCGSQVGTPFGRRAVSLSFRFRVSLSPASPCSPPLVRLSLDHPGLLRTSDTPPFLSALSERGPPCLVDQTWLRENLTQFPQQ